VTRNRPTRVAAFGFALLACIAQCARMDAAQAQQAGSLRDIGFVLVAFSPQDKQLQAFRKGLSDAGYSEGRDVVIEWRVPAGDYAKVPQLVEDLVQRKVDVIVVDTTLAARAAKRATSTIPIVMSLVGDPLGSGLIASLSGLSLMTVDLSAKRLELLKETIPHAKRVAALWDADVPWHPKDVHDLEAAAPGMSIELKPVSARRPEDFDPALSAAKRARVQAMYENSEYRSELSRSTSDRSASIRGRDGHATPSAPTRITGRSSPRHRSAVPSSW